jgi:hypothetical protein
MHESFRLEETVPVPPGTSPFHVRGVIYVSIIDSVKTIPGGMDRFLDELVDARVRDFMRQKFQFMGWYDVCPALPSAVAIARIRGRPFEAYIREAAKDSMLRLVPSMFRLFSRLGGPRLAAAHAPRLFQTYYDFLDLRLSRVSDEGGSGTLTGIPMYVAPQILNHVIGIIDGALESLGAKEIEATYRDVTVSGSHCGFELVTCHGDFRWRLAPKTPPAQP